MFGADYSFHQMMGRITSWSINTFLIITAPHGDYLSEPKQHFYFTSLRKVKMSFRWTKSLFPICYGIKSLIRRNRAGILFLFVSLDSDSVYELLLKPADVYSEGRSLSVPKVM